MRQQMSVFDLGSILIKPVQRILKYPLLLNELIKVLSSLTYLHVKCNNDYSVQNDKSWRGTVQIREESERGIRKWEEMSFKRTAEDGVRGGAAKQVKWFSAQQMLSPRVLSYGISAVLNQVD